MYSKNNKWLKFVISFLLCQNTLCSSISAMRDKSPMIKEINQGNIPVFDGSKGILVKNLNDSKNASVNMITKLKSQTPYRNLLKKNNINLKYYSMSPIVEETTSSPNSSEKYTNALMKFKNTLIKCYNSGAIKFVDVADKSNNMLNINYKKLNNDSLDALIECLNYKLNNQKYDESSGHIHYNIGTSNALLATYNDTYWTQPNNNYGVDLSSKYSNNSYSNNTFSGTYEKYGISTYGRKKLICENFLIKDSLYSAIIAFKIDDNIAFIVTWDKKSNEITFFNVLCKLSFENISFAARHTNSIDEFRNQLSM